MNIVENGPQRTQSPFLGASTMQPKGPLNSVKSLEKYENQVKVKIKKDLRKKTSGIFNDNTKEKKEYTR